MAGNYHESDYAVTVLQPDADRYDSTPSTDVVSLRNAEAVRFVLAEGAGGTGTVKIVGKSATSAAGAGSANLNFKYRVQSTLGTYGNWTETTVAADGYTTTAGANKCVEILVEADTLPEGSPFCFLSLTEVVDSPVDAGIIAIIHGARYNQRTPIDPLA